MALTPPPLDSSSSTRLVTPEGQFVLLTGGHGIMSLQEARTIAALQHRELILERSGSLPVVRLSESGGQPAELIHS
jgi:hypothetical protein